MTQQSTGAPGETAQPGTHPPPGGRSAAVRRAVGEHSVVVAVVAIFIALAVGSDPFLSKSNLLNLLDQSVVVGVIAAAGTLVIVAGGFDLSVGAIFVVAGVVAAKLAPGTGGGLALVLGALSGLGLGLLNGLLVTRGRVNAFLATLGSAIVITGVTTVATGGFIIKAEGHGFTAVGHDTVLGLKWTVVVWALVACACGFALSRTAFGRAVYAVGGNPAVARLSGIDVGLVRTLTFCLSGLAAGIAGVLAASHAGQAQVGTGDGLELSAIAAVAIGGTSILGGRGAVWRTVFGVLLLSLIANGLNLLNVQPAFQQVASGVIIVLALGLEALSRRD